MIPKTSQGASHPSQLVNPPQASQTSAIEQGATVTLLDTRRENNIYSQCI